MPTTQTEVRSVYSVTGLATGTPGRAPARAAAARHKPCVVWLSGLSGAGKTTLVTRLAQQLQGSVPHTVVLDGDRLRQGLCKDLHYNAADRSENLRRAGEVCKLLVESGIIVLAAFVSPARADRDMVRAMLGEGEFIEVYCNAPLSICEARDVKGLYAKARDGQIPDFTGVSAPYEAPLAPELVLDTAFQSIDGSLERILQMLIQRGVIDIRQV